MRQGGGIEEEFPGFSGCRVGRAVTDGGIEGQRVELPGAEQPVSLVLSD